MNSSILVRAATAAFLLLGCTGFAFAQGPSGGTAGGQRPRASVVVVDVGKVFNEHLRFKQSMEIMKQDVENFRNYIRQEQERIQKTAEQRKQYDAGTPEYKRIEENATRMQSELAVQIQLKEKEFTEREAKLFYNTYLEVQQKVAEFADRYAISMVLRYNSEKMDPEDRASVMAGINSPIVFQRDLDITGLIITEVNRYTQQTDRRGIEAQFPQK